MQKARLGEHWLWKYQQDQGLQALLYTACQGLKQRFLIHVFS